MQGCRLTLDHMQCDLSQGFSSAAPRTTRQTPHGPAHTNAHTGTQFAVSPPSGCAPAAPRPSPTGSCRWWPRSGWPARTCGNVRQHVPITRVLTVHWCPMQSHAAARHATGQRLNNVTKDSNSPCHRYASRAEAHTWACVPRPASSSPRRVCLSQLTNGNQLPPAPAHSHPPPLPCVVIRRFVPACPV